MTARDERELAESDSLGLVRLRLGLSLLAMLFVPVVIATPIVYRWTTKSAMPLLPILLLGALATALGVLTYWMARKVLEPAEKLDAARMTLRALYERAKLEALIDSLTGLGNHRAFQEELDRQIEHARRYRTGFSLILLDLDDFKLINDDGGHAAGDAVLVRMGTLCRQSLRQSDRAYRVGGDEFALILPEADPESARHTGMRLLARALEPAPGVQTFSFSGGVAAFPGDAGDRPQLFRRADAALYGSKSHGRTMVEVFDAATHRTQGDSRTAQELAVAVQEVSAARLLTPVFQPIVSLATGEVIGVEGLVRPTPESGFANPGALFAAAEVAGRTIELDLACLEVLIAAAVNLPHHIYVSLNISPRTLEASEFSPSLLAGLLTRYGLDPSRLVLELTEREAVEDFERLRLRLEGCRRMGVRIAADDVGAGNAGLRLLSQVRFDIVKIDLSLVQDGALRSSSLAVLRSLRDLAAGSDAVTIAEGVETSEQLRLVQEVGIPAAQGYLLGRPAARVDFKPVDVDVLALDFPYVLAAAAASR